MTPNPPAAAPAPAPQKKKMSGCLIALFIVGGLFGLACLIGGIGLFAASRSPEGKKIFSVVGKGMEIAAKGMNAPGTAELRKAGCPQAMVMDVGEMVEEFAEIFDAGTEKKDAKVGVMVMCQGNMFQNLPDCDTLAPIYAAAAHPTDGFTVIVQQQGKQKPHCTRQYLADGTGGSDLKTK